MSKKLTGFADWVYGVVGSSWVFVVTMVLMAVQSVWLAFSAYYPLPFDEFVHVGNIQIYAQQWLPFISVQPASASIYGDITREPSFLYYYLMSFPYRFFELFTHNQMALIICTRLMNVAFVLIAMWFFRKLLLEWRVSGRIINVAMLAFVATPLVPFIAAHVNYDNMMIMFAALFLIQATKLIKSNRQLVWRIMLFALFGLLALLSKRTFFPLAAIVGLYVLVVLWHRNGRKIGKVLIDSWAKTAKGWVFGLVVVGLVLLGGLFLERYGGNALRYKALWPECQQIQPVEVCTEFGPWHRDHVNALQTHAKPAFGNPASFTQYWLTYMMRGYYALFAYAAGRPPEPGDPYGAIDYKGFLPVLLYGGYAALAGGLACVVWQFRRLWANSYLRFGLVISLGYVFAQWLFNYQTYLGLGRAAAIQARYTYPILIILFVVMTQAASWAVKNKLAKTVMVVMFVVVYVWNGGIAGWIIRSPDTWHWQNNTVQDANHGAKNILKYMIINSPK